MKMQFDRGEGQGKITLNMDLRHLGTSALWNLLKSNKNLEKRNQIN
jgi:hypothetical protein